jgi:hypothetical protein
MIGAGRRKKRGVGGVISPERTFDIPVVYPYQSALLPQHHLQLWAMMRAGNPGDNLIR